MKGEGIYKSMLPIHFLKKRFPNSPDWLIGGLLFIGIFWLIVWPLELYKIFVSEEYYFSHSNLGFFSKAFYMQGFVISMSWASTVHRAFTAEPTAAFIMTLLSILISSPGYFLIGALLATRRPVVFISGIVLIVVNMVINCFFLVGLSILASG